MELEMPPPDDLGEGHSQYKRAHRRKHIHFRLNHLISIKG
jgi:hypothetical protein